MFEWFRVIAPVLFAFKLTISILQISLLACPLILRQRSLLAKTTNVKLLGSDPSKVQTFPGPEIQLPSEVQATCSEIPMASYDTHDVPNKDQT